MSLIDKAFLYFSPQKAIKRAAAKKVIEVINSGYSEHGASTSKRSMRGWDAFSSSPDEDINSNLSLLRHRSRDLFMSSTIARSAINTTKTNVIGSGLKLKPRIDAEFLNLSMDESDAWKRKVEREFALWADSEHCDITKENNFYDLQILAFGGMLMNGDSFTLIKNAKPEDWMPYTLRLHLIEGDRITNPDYVNFLDTGHVQAVNQKNGNRIISGIEINSDGAVVAYWVANRYPQAIVNTVYKPLEYVRIEAFGKNTGRPNVIKLMETERAEQRRGVPFLAPIIEDVKKIAQYTQAELTAALISAFFTVFVTTEGNSSDIPFGSMVPDELKSNNTDPSDYEMGAGAINVLAPGEKIETANPNRPNVAFDGFVGSVTKYIGAALEIPQELLLKSFSSSYSASRAALLEAWKMFRTRRVFVGRDFCQPIYEEWLSQAVSSGRINAPGFFIDPIVRKAWCQADWNGPAPGQVDPVKEVTAAEKRIALCLSTREEETIAMTAGDFNSNIEQLKREKEKLKGVLPDAGGNSESSQKPASTK